jgi:hypothetical protein
MSEQERLSFLATNDLLSISDAARLTPYSAEYISLLARQGRIPAVKISRNWLTTRKAVLLYVHTQLRKHKKLVNQLQGAERRMA